MIKRAGAMLLLAAMFAPCIVRASDKSYGMELMLPYGVTSQWIIYPDMEGKPYVNDYCFDFDLLGNIWFGMGGATMVNPIAKSAMRVDRTFENFLWLDSNEFVMVADGSIGVLTYPEKSANSPFMIMKFRPQVRLPYRDFRLFPAEGAAVYMLGRNPRTGKREVYLLRQADGKGTIEKLLATNKNISYVTGDGAETYVAVGRTIFRLDHATKEINGIFQHPVKRICSISFGKASGLFYTTPDEVGFIGKKGRCEIMKAPGPFIRQRGDALLVLLKDRLGLLLIDGVSAFGKLDAGANKGEPK